MIATQSVLYWDSLLYDCLVPVLQTVGHGTLFLPDLVVVEVQYWHDFISAHHHHFGAFQSLIDRYVAERYLVDEGSLLCHLLKPRQDFLEGCTLYDGFEPRAGELLAEDKGHVGDRCLKNNLVFGALHALVSAPSLCPLSLYL
jgi:hypothetical protein